MKKNIPDMSEIHNLLDQDYNQKTIVAVQNATVFQVSAPASVEPSVNATQGSYSAPKQNRLVCSHCGYNAHTVDKCYKVHGYPPGFNSKSKQKFQNDKSGYSEKQPSYNKPRVA